MQDALAVKRLRLGNDSKQVAAGPVLFDDIELGPILDRVDGLIPLYAALDSEVGTEVILVLHDRTDFMNQLKSVKPFNLLVKTGVARNDYGILAFLLFWIQDPVRPSSYVVAYDLYLNPAEEQQWNLWRHLASQTHWHLFLVGASSEQEELFEFENCYGLNEFLDATELGCRGIPIIDFNGPERNSANSIVSGRCSISDVRLREMDSR